MVRSDGSPGYFSEVTESTGGTIALTVDPVAPVKLNFEVVKAPAISTSSGSVVVSAAAQPTLAGQALVTAAGGATNSLIY